MANVGNAAARNNGTSGCAPTPPATCYQDECKHCYCLGPENYGVNAPVCPKTCNGDFIITVSGFYWNAHQDGMEYAIDNSVQFPDVLETTVSTNNPEIQALNTQVQSEYLTPGFDWDFGFKVGLGYCTTCDGWDLGVTWTWYRGKANDSIDYGEDDNHTLLPLWSAFAPAQGAILYASQIDTHWKVQLNLVDFELGRGFWTSKYLSIRPHVGFRVAFIDQKYEIEHSGGSWEEREAAPLQDPFNNFVKLDNDFKGVGIRSGLDSYWNLGCGWAIFGNLAASIIYGRFDVDHDEYNREASAVHGKIKVLELDDSFRASRAILDLALGVQWATMFCDCQYGFTVRLGWEQHLFFDQNQLWRVTRIGDVSRGEAQAALPNNTGENVFQQRRGDLDTQGWTVTLKFDF